MSISNKLKSNKLWTAPQCFKDQYLPGYMKILCEEYLARTDAKRLYPVKCMGWQSDFSRADMWVIWGNAHIRCDHGHTTLLTVEESPFCLLEDMKVPLPLFDINSGLDDGTSLRKLIELEQHIFGTNYQSALLIIGGLGISTHYEFLADRYHGIPLIMAFGEPVTQKSTAVECALSLFGREDCIGDCSVPGLLEVARKQTFPFWWDDVSSLKVLEQFALMSFNKADRKTKNKSERNRTTPLVTMNPDILGKKALNSSRAMRIFTRIAVIPFKKDETQSSLADRLHTEEQLTIAKKLACQSVGGDPISKG